MRRYQNPDGSLTDLGKKRMAKDIAKYEKVKNKAANKLQTIMDNPKQRIRNGFRADSVLQNAAKMSEFKSKVERKYNNKSLKELHDIANPKAMLVLLNAFNFRKPDYGIDKYPGINAIKTGKAILSEAQKQRAMAEAAAQQHIDTVNRFNLENQQNVDRINQINFENQQLINMQNTQMISQMSLNQIHTMQMHNMF